MSSALKETTTCECGQSVAYEEMADHRAVCPVYQAELAKAAKKLAVKPPAQYLFNYLSIHSYVNRSTFACPLCKTDNLVQKDIVKHINAKHKGKPGVYLFE